MDYIIRNYSLSKFGKPLFEHIKNTIKQHTNYLIATFAVIFRINEYYNEAF